MSDGMLLADGVLLSEVYTRGARALVRGDKTASTFVIKETTTTTTKHK